MELIAEIMTILQNAQDEISEKLVEAVLRRLEGFGCAAKEGDAWLVAFCIQKVDNRINSACNTLTIPDGLFNVAVDRACGEVMFSLQQSGKLEPENIDLSGAVTQIREGDATIQFANGSSDAEKFTVFVNYLMHEGEGEFACYRKIKW